MGSDSEESDRGDSKDGVDEKGTVAGAREEPAPQAVSNKPQDENVNERILEELKLIRRHLVDSASFSDDVAVTAAEALAEQLDQSDLELSTLHKDIATLNTRVEELTASTKEIGNSSQALENLTTGLIVLTVWLIVLATSSFIVDAQSHGLIPNTFSAWVFDLFLISVAVFATLFLPFYRRRAKRNAKGKNAKTVKAAIIFAFIVVGVLLSVWGASNLIAYGNQPTDTIASLDTGIAAEWTGWNLPQVQLKEVIISVTPNVNYSSASYFYVDLPLSLGANTTFYFALISPFIISSKIDSSNGNWTFQNLPNTGSVVLYTDKTNTSDAGPQAATGTFYLSGLPARNEHGTHTLYFPFQGPIPDNLSSLLPKDSQFGSDKYSIISFLVGIPLKDQLVNSYPSFNAVIPYKDPVVNAPYAQFQFNMNRSTNLSPVSLTYNNSTEEDQWTSTQSNGILFVTLGLPIVIFVSWDLFRFKEQI